MHKQTIALTALATTAMISLSGCGGGGGDSENPGAPGISDKYVVYEENANRHIILDAVSTQFAVKESNKQIAALASGQVLNDLYAGENGSIIYKGQQIASIILTAGQDGRKIATLACSGPAPNLGLMTISVIADSWSYKCASNTEGNGSPSSGGNHGGDSPSPGTETPVSQANAVACLSLDRTSNSLTAFWVNSCNKAVTVVWFDQGDCSTRGCMDASIPAGRRSSIGLVKGNYKFAACFDPYSPRTPGQTSWLGGDSFVCVR